MREIVWRVARLDAASRMGYARRSGRIGGWRDLAVPTGSGSRATVMILFAFCCVGPTHAHYASAVRLVGQLYASQGYGFAELRASDHVEMRREQ